VRALLARLESAVQLIILLFCGTGIRILDCLRRRVQDVDLVLGHKDVKTTMVYTHVLNIAGARRTLSTASVERRSPLGRRPPISTLTS
jgi:hypothetical protein